MPKNKDPAVLFYTSDFLADTTLWKYDELGRYIKLLCIQHLQGGISEDDFTAVADGCKRVLEKFVKGEDGKYRNHRMEQEVSDRASFSKKQQSNGSKGGRPKNPNETQTKAKLNPNESQTKPKRNPNESPRDENENVNINISNTDSFSFSNKTTTINAQACEGDDDRKADSQLRTEICEYFESVGYKSSPHIFIEYNEARGWQGPNGVDLRKNYRWMSYADEWERRERGWNGESEED